MIKKKIVFVIGKLSAGGAERVISTLSNNLVGKYHVTIITSFESSPFYALDKNVKIVSCFEQENSNSTGFLSSIKLNFQLAKKITDLSKQEGADVLIGFITQINVLTVISSRINRIPCIISERTNPVLDETINGFWKTFRRIFYPFADCLIVQTSAVQNFYKKYLGVDKIKLLPNPISIGLAERKQSIPKKNIVLNVGRLHKVKNQKLLVEVFSEINPETWELHIVGEGPERGNLESLIVKNQMKGKIILHGNQTDIAKFYNQSKVFVFTSNYEGFPNALIEAQYFGLACISVDCPSGPSDIITDGHDGFLIPQHQAQRLKKMLEKLISDEMLQKKFGENSIENSKKYASDYLMTKWDEVIEKLI
ncbi:glycosyltransferase family 4 protein [Flagellimonas sp. S3867]|uniref:glycosyltransferase family 4 protein n=1 Tax=Flagellimonas sp. S3867 TaxID=2768063 RepID=UPI001683E955